MQQGGGPATLASPPHLALTLPSRPPAHRPSERGILPLQNRPCCTKPGLLSALCPYKENTALPKPQKIKRKKETKRIRNQIAITNPSLKSRSLHQIKPPLTAPTLPPPRSHLSLSSPKGDPFFPPRPPNAHTHPPPPFPSLYRAPYWLPEGKGSPWATIPPSQPCTHLPETSCLCSRRRRRHRPSSCCRASLPHSIAQRGGGAWPFPRPARSAAHPHCGRLGDPQRRRRRPRPGPLPLPSPRARRPGPRCLPAPVQEEAAAARPLLPHPARH